MVQTKEEKNTTIRLPVQLHRAVKIRMIEDGQMFNPLVLSLLRQWVDREIELPAQPVQREVTGDSSILIADIESVLSSGNTTAIALLRTSIQAAVELCASSRAQDPRHPEARTSIDLAEALADAERLASEAGGAVRTGNDTGSGNPSGSRGRRTG